MNSPYDAFALGRQLAAPVNAWAAAVRSFWTHPAVPPFPFARAMAAASDLLERSTRNYPKPPFDLPSIVVDGRTVAVQETAILGTPFCDLLHFRRDVDRNDPKVLLVAPLSGHHASLIRDTVATLLPAHDVYVTDWIDARLVPLAEGGFDLDDYIDIVLRFVRAVGPGVHLVAVCQPVVAALAATALLAEDGDAALPRTLTLMAGPIDTRVSPTAPTKLAAKHSLDWFDRHMVHRVPYGEPGAGRRVYPGFLQLGGFIAMNPERHTRAHLDLARHVIAGNEVGAGAHRRFYDDYFAVMDMPAEYYLQTIATVFQRHDLPLGRMLHRKRPVRPEAIRTTALMTIEGGKDDITGRGQTQAAHALLTSLPPDRKLHHHEPGVGHYGVFGGRRWRENIAPAFAAFIRRHPV